MDHPDLAAYLVAARHDPARIAELFLEAENAEDAQDTIRDTVFALLSLMHLAGHASTNAAMLLDLYAGFPESFQRNDVNVSVVRADQPLGEHDIEELFRSTTEDTDPADRVWNYRVLAGALPVHAVVLEGTGFTPRYLAVMAGDARAAESLRARLAARDHR